MIRTMAKKKVIKYSNNRLRAPFMSGFITFVILRHFDCPEWLYGVLGFLYLLWFIIWVYEIFVGYEEVDIIGRLEELEKNIK